MEKESKVFVVPTAKQRASALGEFESEESSISKNWALKKVLEDSDGHHKPIPKPGILTLLLKDCMIGLLVILMKANPLFNSRIVVTIG